MKNSLRVLRAERNWSQADLADQLGVSRQTVNALETGKYDPSLPLAFKIARLFDRLIEDIFDPEEPEIAHRRPRLEEGGLFVVKHEGGSIQVIYVGFPPESKMEMSKRLLDAYPNLEPKLKRP